MIDTEDVIARIRAKQKDREFEKRVVANHEKQMERDLMNQQMLGRVMREPSGCKPAVKELTTEDLVRRCRDRRNFGTSDDVSDLAQQIRDAGEAQVSPPQQAPGEKAEDIIQMIRNRQKELDANYKPLHPAMITDTARGIEPVVKDFVMISVSMVKEADDVDPFDYAMQLVEK